MSFLVDHTDRLEYNNCY